MDYKKWKPIYFQILKDFNFPIEKDKEAAKILNNLVKKDNALIQFIEDLIFDKKVVVFGSGPSLEKAINENIDFLKDKVLIAADGATSALVKNNILPDIIVTDLDGYIPDQIKVNMDGSLIVVQAHGDNIDKIEKYVPQFKGKIIGTTQGDPKPFVNLYNFGGFTDGDRGVVLAEHFRAKKIFLIGFDLNDEVGRYSFAENKNIELKLKKLVWCKKILELLEKNDIILIKVS